MFVPVLQITPSETTKEAKRTISVDKKHSITKAAKVGDASDGEADLSKNSKDTLTKDIAALEKISSGLAELVATAKESALKAPAVVVKPEAGIANLESNMLLVEVVLVNGKDDVANAVKDCKEAKSEAAVCSKIMKAELLVAKTMAAPVMAE